MPTNGAGADHTISVTMETWADIVSTKLAFSQAVASGAVTIDGDINAVSAALACLEHTTLAN